jgi:hypothetical protein
MSEAISLTALLAQCQLHLLFRTSRNNILPALVLLGVDRGRSKSLSQRESFVPQDKDWLLPWPWSTRMFFFSVKERAGFSVPIEEV